jgi:thiamine-phosphate pyrophosphorylase
VCFPDFDLYLVTDRHQTRGRDLLWVLQQALEAGVHAIQLREKDLNGKDLFRLAEKVRRLCTDYRALLLINDRIDVALAMAADGVQVGTAGVPVETVRELIGTQKLLGVSTHSLNEARQAVEGGADFVLFGPVYFTASKAAFGAPQGLAALKEIVEKIPLPVYAIGGINADNLADARAAGIRGVAVISAVLAADDPKSAAAKLLGGLRR